MEATRAKRKVESHRDLEIWQRARELAQCVFELPKQFPKAETCSLTDQIRRSSRSVTANIAETWQKRRYEASFTHKLTDSAAEAAETQDWVIHAFDCGYVDSETARSLSGEYDNLLKSLHGMMLHGSAWCKPASTHRPQTTNHRDDTPA